MKLPQTYAALGLSAAVVASYIGNGYFGGAPPALYTFLTSASAFFLTAINCRTRRHLQWIAFLMLLCSIFYIARGSYDLYHHVVPSPYVFGAETLPRLRGLGVVHDPNDFAQVLVSLIPCIFLWKSKKSGFANVFLVWIPIGLLITGMFLTHSRGSAIALMVVCAVASRRKIGTVPAAVISGILLVVVLAFGWSGGRDVSMEAGADRLDAWSVGLEFIKSHPFVGVGAGRFADFNDITAHNSVIVCAAEIGLPGLILWVLFIFSTYRAGIAFSKTGEVIDGKQEDATADLPSPADFWKPKIPVSVPAATQGSVAVAEPVTTVWAEKFETEQKVDPVELRRIAALLVVAITGFLAAGWFLSRAYSMWLFLYVGMLCATVRMAEENGIPVHKDNPGYLLRWSVMIAAGLIVFVYVLLKVRSALGK